MKKILATVLVIVMLLAFTACSSAIKYKYAYITLPNGNIIEVEVESYIVYTNSATIKAKDGRKYMVSMVNCLLTTDRLDEVEE